MVLIDLHWGFFTYWKSMGTSNWRWTIPLKVIYAAHYTAIMWHLNRICDEKINSHEIFKCGCFIPYCSQIEWEFVLHPGKGNSVIIYSNLLKLFQTCVSFFLLLNTKDDILRNANNWTCFSPHWIPYNFFHFFQISCFILSRIKKLIQVCKLWQI